MSSAQHPIGSGFGATTTAAEVLQGIDLRDRLAIVTGGYSGLGLEITRALATAGAHVVVPARRPAAAHEAVDGLGSVEVGELDLADQVSVAAFAEQFLASDRSIDMLVGNAGVMACPERHVDVNGTSVELQLATNHLGHYALANRLWPALSADGGARVVSVSSLGHRQSPIRWDDLDFATGYDKWKAYGQAKTANILFALQLDALGADSSVRAFSLHPGGILTPLQRHLPLEEQVALGWLNEDGSPKAGINFKTPEQGAATATWAATSPQLDGLGGLYLEDADVAPAVAADASGSGVRPWAIDPGEAARLWAWSAEITGIDAFAASPH